MFKLIKLSELTKHGTLSADYYIDLEQSIERISTLTKDDAIDYIVCAVTKLGKQNYDAIALRVKTHRFIHSTSYDNVVDPAYLKNTSTTKGLQVLVGLLHMIDTESIYRKKYLESELLKITTLLDKMS